MNAISCIRRDSWHAALMSSRQQNVFCTEDIDWTPQKCRVCLFGLLGKGALGKAVVIVEEDHTLVCRSAFITIAFRNELDQSLGQTGPIMPS